MIDEEMNEEEEEDGGMGWDDDDDDNNLDESEDVLRGPVKCLFCERILNAAMEAFAHSDNDHSFHLLNFCHRWSLDCIGYIKLINFIRSTVGPYQFLPKKKIRNPV